MFMFVLILIQSYTLAIWVKFLEQFYFNEHTSLMGDQTALVISPLEGVSAVHGAIEHLSLSIRL